MVCVHANVAGNLHGSAHNLFGIYMGLVHKGQRGREGIGSPRADA